ncbi:MAG: SUMF1/EgtB/PvdO family nonheme iron enzyme [Sphingomonas bacterium]
MSRIIPLLFALPASTLSASACSVQQPSADKRTLAQAPSAAPTKVSIGQVIRDCVDCPEMVAVPQVGRTASDPGKIFYAGRFEVTSREYLFAVREGVCPSPQKGFGGFFNANDPKINDNYPLTGEIGLDQFKCYLSWINNKTKKKYRIPSGDEWEHIARAGTSGEYYWGNDIGYNNAVVFGYFDLDLIKNKLKYPKGNFLNDERSDVKFEKVFPVGMFKPNPWGIFDIIGNAAEVTTESYPPTPVCIQKRTSGACDMLVARGNDIGRRPYPSRPNSSITVSLTTARYRTSMHYGVYGVGFRLIRD